MESRGIRHARIRAKLKQLEQYGAVTSWYSKQGSRKGWIVNSHVYSTREVEAFIEGIETMRDFLYKAVAAT